MKISGKRITNRALFRFAIYAALSLWAVPDLSAQGDGSDGALTVTQTTVIDTVKTALATTAEAGETTLQVSSTAGFEPGRLVVILQMVGTGAGTWEEAQIKKVGSDSIQLTEPLQRGFVATSTDRAQILLVRQYTDVTISTGGTLTCAAWNGAVGGVLWFKATGKVTLGPGAFIDVTAKGGRGGGGGSGGSGGGGGSAGTSGLAGGYGGANPAPGGQGQDTSGTGVAIDGNSGGVGGTSGDTGASDGSTGAVELNDAASAGGGGVNLSAQNLRHVILLGSGGSGAGGGKGGTGGGGGGGGGSTRGYSPGFGFYTIPGSSGAVGSTGLPGNSGSNGGRGGGIVRIDANVITGTGSIIANGEPGAVGGTGGAGGGGGSGGRGADHNFYQERSGFSTTTYNIAGAGGGGGGGRGGTGGAGGVGSGGGAGGSVLIRAAQNAFTGMINVDGGNGGNGGSGGTGGAGGSGGSNGTNGTQTAFTGYALATSGAQGGTGVVGSSGAAGGNGSAGRSSAGINRQPVANADSIGTQEDTPIILGTLNVLSNDSDPDGDRLDSRLVAAPTKGTLSLLRSGQFAYSPNPNANGVDQFQYRSHDGIAASDATVTINIAPVNDAPVSTSGNVSGPEDSDLALNLGSDIDGDNLTVELIEPPAHGSIIGSWPVLSYRPPLNFVGTDRFVFRLGDGQFISSLASANIQITAVNDRPSVQDDSFSIAESGTLEVSAPGVLENDSDVENGQALLVQLLDFPRHGRVTLNSNGAFLYVPEEGFAGRDSFTYAANDGALESLPGLVSVVVRAKVPITGARYFGISQGLEGAGRLSITSGANNIVTGSGTFGSQKFTFKGTLENDGSLQLEIPRSSRPALTLNLQLTTENGVDEFKGSITDGTTSLSISAGRQTDGKAAPTPEQGRYTLLLKPNPGDSNPSVFPEGIGFATLVVSKSGRIRVVGVLADGRRFTYSSAIARDRSCFVFIPLEGGTGHLVGRLSFEVVDGTITGALERHKQERLKDKAYPEGFRTALLVEGSQFSPAPPGEQPFEFLGDPDEGRAIVHGGNLGGDRQANVVLNVSKGASETQSPFNLTFAINPKSGLITGKLSLPDGDSLKIKGAILQRQHEGGGFFINEGRSGSLVLQAQP